MSIFFQKCCCLFLIILFYDLLQIYCKKTMVFKWMHTTLKIELIFSNTISTIPLIFLANKVLQKVYSLN